MKTADVVGLGAEIVGYGVDTAVDVAEKLFDSRPSHWQHDVFTPLQLFNECN